MFRNNVIDSIHLIHSIQYSIPIVIPKPRLWLYGIFFLYYTLILTYMARLNYYSITYSHIYN